MITDLIDEHELLAESYADLLQRVLAFAAKKENISKEAELSVSIVNNEEIQQLNKAYRQLDQPTDVLSFPLDEDELVAVEGMPILLGDIIISYEKLIEQAKDFNHTIERELCFLAVHGFLHLLGFTHDDDESEREMFAKQEAILQEFGLER